MASISKEGDRYKVRWRVGSKARAKRFDTFAAADAYRISVESDVLNRRAVADTTTTLSAWAEPWQENRQGLRPSTMARNVSLYWNHIRPAFGHMRLGDITPVQVQSWVGDLARKGLAPTTIRECYQEFSKCMTAAVNARALRDTPCIGITLPRVEHQDMHFLDHAQVKELADAIDDRYRALVYLLAYGGLRIGEAAALTPADVTASGVSVSKTASEVKGHMVTNQPKTKAGRRTVPLPSFVRETLGDHMAKYPGPWVFTGRDGGQVRAGVFRQRQFAKAKASVNPALRIHDLRHTAVSLWIAQGVDLLRIKKWAGHTSATFTLDRYGHLFEDENEAVLLRLDAGIATVHGDTRPLGDRPTPIETAELK